MKKILTILALCFVFNLANIACAVQYKDIKVEDAYYEQITTLSNKGILFGYPDGNYKPLNTMTRGEYASIVVHALKLLNKPYEEKAYLDLNKEHWANKYLQIASFYDLVQGDTTGHIYPNEPITRLEIITSLANALNLGEITKENADKLLSEYKDSNLIPAWAKLQVALALNYDLVIPAKEEATLAPLKNATRAEVAGFISKLLAASEKLPEPKLKDGKIGIRLFKGEVIESAYKEGKYTVIPAGTVLPLAIMECSIQKPLDNGMDFRAKTKKHYITKENRLIFPANTEFYGKFVEVKKAKKFIRNERLVLQTVNFVNSRTKEEGKIMMSATVEPKYNGETILDKINYYIIRGKKALIHKSSTGNFVILEPYKVEIVDEFVQL